ncbi:MAG TPA: GntR family transcriptional regulator [Xanthobacteraceae bacterium]
MSDEARVAASERAALGFRPLYRQVKDVLVRRIADGVWAAGGALPSEPDIAADLGVSHGTVRKALDELAAENLVVRRQGKGTYVARHDEERILFQFFKLIPDAGGRRFPDSRILGVEVREADADATRILNLRKGARVVAIERVRMLADTVCIYERIVLPKALFSGIEKRDLPNNLYELYRAEFAVTIARATERLKAVSASRREAKHLDVAVGAPLLAVDRTALAIDGAPVEWRVSLCRTDAVHYLSDLR